MQQRLQAVVFDVDTASLISLREALPRWQIKEVYGAMVSSLPCDWNPGIVDLLVVGVRENVSETLGLCRFLAFCSSYSRDSRQEAAEKLRLRRGLLNPARRMDAPLLVLVPSGQGTLVRAALAAGADDCLILPIHAKEVARMVAHVRQGNQPCPHTCGLPK